MNQQRRQKRHHRLRSRLRGSAARPRVSVFRSSRLLTVQFIDDDAARTLLAASTTPAPKATKVMQAQTLGEAVAKQAREKGIARVVFDRGGYAYHGRVKALAEALRSGGLEF